jgi:putative mycofactocin binding protein MftB
MNEPKYKLAHGAQVREEDFGLLFYSMHGPRLYFLASGDLLQENFFQGHVSLESWVDKSHPMSKDIAVRILPLKRSLKTLADKGVIIEC